MISKTMTSKIANACRLLHLVAILAPALANSFQSLTAQQASKHIGEQATVCGEVASTKYADRSKGSPTFINLDSPYPNQIFTALVWGENRSRFPSPPESMHGRVCVSGQISNYQGTPEIIVRDPSQITSGK